MPTSDVASDKLKTGRDWPSGRKLIAVSFWLAVPLACRAERRTQLDQLSSAQHLSAHALSAPR